MKQLIFGMTLLAAALAGCTTLPPVQETDGAEPHALAYGIVESVREARLREGPAALEGVFEHPVKPDTADEIRVRIDDGRAITVVQDSLRQLAPGQRVVVIPSRRGARVEAS